MFAFSPAPPMNLVAVARLEHNVMKIIKAECDRKTVEELAAQPKSPITFNEKLNEYHLVSGNGKVHYRMYFCFFCGGQLPESERAGFFTEPSAEAMREVADLMGKIRS